MTTTKTGASLSSGASARSKNGKGKHVEFRGLTLLLPNEPPGDLMFSIEENEASAAVREIFGEKQYVQIREKCKEDKLTLTKQADALGQLIADCFVAWGFKEGE